MSRLVAALALVLAILSLALNLYLIQRLNQGRVAVLNTLDRTSQRLQSLPDATFHYTVRVNQSFPVAGEMPVNQNFNVPVKLTVPINMTTHVNVNTLLGNMDVPVNVNTTVPVDLNVPIAFNTTIPYSLTVPLNLEMPVDIRLRDIGIDQGVNEAEQEIQNLRQSLQ